LAIQAHASDEDGIAQFEFYANDTLLQRFDADGGRLSEAIYEWTPSEPGVYRIDVRATDAGGNTGSNASIVVRVDGDLLETPLPPLTLQETATTFAQSVVTETPAPGGSGECALAQLAAPVLQVPSDNSNVNTPVRFTWSDAPYQEIGCHPQSWRVDISEFSNFSDTSWGLGTLDHLEISRDWSLPAGKCYYWRVLAYVPDDYGPPSPTRYFCILAAPPLSITETPTLIPTVTASPTVELITDTAPPSFFSIGVSPEIFCPTSAPPNDQVTVAAAVTDESGLSSVIAYWHIGGSESGQVNLQEGGLGYWATIGPVSTTTGTMEVYITAWDTYGNVAQSDTMYVSLNCIG
jgi:hypothetical protein